MANALKDIDIKNQDTLDILNNELSSVTGDAFVTPYMALERVRKVLGYFHIHLPAYRFMDSEEGNTVFHVDQFGDKAGFDENGNIMEKEDSGLFLYFEWSADDNGIYTVFSEVVNEDELDELLDAYEDEEEDEDMINEAKNTGGWHHVTTETGPYQYQDFVVHAKDEHAAVKKVHMHHDNQLSYRKKIYAAAPDKKRMIASAAETRDRDKRHTNYVRPVSDENGVPGATKIMRTSINEDIDVEVPGTRMKIKTIFAKWSDLQNEKDRQNEMAAGRPVNEGMEPAHSRWAKEKAGKLGGKKPLTKEEGIAAAKARMDARKAKETVEEEALQENLSLSAAKAKAKRASSTGVSHVNKLSNGKFHTTPWSSKTTVISYERGKSFNDKTMKEEPLHELRTKTLASYIGKASEQSTENLRQAYSDYESSGGISGVRAEKKSMKRDKGIQAAVRALIRKKQD